MEILALGAGVQSTALLLMNATGWFPQPVAAAVFADTGGEMPETYDHLWHCAAYVRPSFPVIVVSRQPRLEEWNKRYCVLPMRDGDNLLPRRCTTSWKAEPIERWARANGVRQLTVQLGISVEESHRMKASPKAWVTRRWPLVEMNWTREDARRYVIKVLGVEPPRSACFFCPLRPRSWWRYLAAYHPDLFERACHVEESAPSREGYRPYYLSGLGRPLRQAFGGGQLPLLDDGQQGAECEGFCFV